ncbi:Nn.00g031100.m01.CDS01 [Neocucurbitaria sp. VM-36]
MSSLLPPSPIALPSSPRANRQMQMLSPLDTSFSSSEARTPSPYSGMSEKHSPQSLIDTRHRNRDSLIFANATIPLSPASSTSSSLHKESPYDGLTPRKRSGLARLFCCFGREERARRRVIRETEFEKVGEPCHWSEY